MVERTEAAVAAGPLLRVSVRAGERRTDIGIPGAVPLAEVLPSLMRRLRLLDAAEAHAGYGLHRPDGSVLDLDRSLLAQGVGDGDLLVVQAGAAERGEKTYDDIVEAVADVVDDAAAPWRPDDTVTTATVAASLLLVLAAIPVVLSGLDAPGPLAPIGGGLSAIVLLTAAAVLDRLGVPAQAPVAIVQVAAIHAAVAGFTATGQPAGWGVPAALAGLAAAVVGAVSLGLVRRGREYALIPLVAGLVFAIAGGLIGVAGLPLPSVLAMALALAGIAGLGVPWLALAAVPLRIPEARDDSEILAAPEPISRELVAERYARGLRMQVALRIVVGAVALIVTVPVAASGGFGLGLALATYLGMLLGIRQIHARVDIVVVASTSLGGIVIAVVAAVLAHPSWGAGIIIGLAAAAALVIGLALVAPRHRLGLNRLADPAEIVAVALLLPLALLAGGLA
ncbi:type VII secretion integral membrane protein EccD [Homoserinibacter sp. YIM 151385]|uniref:type VII secretion integral membrane protein EccD n=1 Tax=Homoserinibacter sp. YIM 151385 TaxID=2985506 RepID=UPI0022EFDA3B|nr:type VII secretion integral membrane protein EccD [Homoserinibacter sp. YIM 151385]WBU38691.1 type VII secretion integral membrane protein EccD [Homoserinibacter sp. YIM 151385]